MTPALRKLESEKAATAHWYSTAYGISVWAARGLSKPPWAGGGTGLLKEGHCLGWTTMGPLGKGLVGLAGRQA